MSHVCPGHSPCMNVERASPGRNQISAEWFWMVYSSNDLILVFECSNVRSIFPFSAFCPPFPQSPVPVPVFSRFPILFFYLNLLFYRPSPLSPPPRQSPQSPQYIPDTPPSHFVADLLYAGSPRWGEARRHSNGFSTSFFVLFLCCLDWCSALNPPPISYHNTVL